MLGLHYGVVGLAFAWLGLRLRVAGLALLELVERRRELSVTLEFMNYRESSIFMEDPKLNLDKSLSTTLNSTQSSFVL